MLTNKHTNFISDIKELRHEPELTTEHSLETPELTKLFNFKNKCL